MRGADPLIPSPDSVEPPPTPLTIRDETGARDVDVVADPAAVTFGEFLAAAGCAARCGTVDGRSYPADTLLAHTEVRPGSVVTAAPVTPHGTPPDPAGTGPAVPGTPGTPGAPGACAGPVVAVVGGARAGGWHAIAEGLVLGRDPRADVVLADPSVSWHHLELAVRQGAVLARDLGSRNGTFQGTRRLGTGGERLEVPCLLSVGAARLRVLPAVPTDPPAAADAPSFHPEPWHRPPRPAQPAGPSPLTVPTSPPPRATVGPLNLAAVLAPLILGAALIAFTREPRFVLFLALSPLLALVTWWSARHRARRADRRAGRDFAAELATFAGALTAARRVEQQRREARAPDLAEVLRRALLPSRRLWERRHGDDDALLLRIGTGDLAWRPPVEATDDVDVIAAIDAARTLARAPVTVDLADGAVLGLVGPRSETTAVARSLLIQAAVLHGPADLGVRVDSTHPELWGWVAWLPHAAPSGDAPGAPTRLLLVDGVAAGRREAVRTALAEPQVSGIVLAGSTEALPAVVSTVLEISPDDGVGRLERPRRGERIGAVVADGLDAGLAESVGRALARYHDPEQGGPGQDLPATVRFGDVLSTPFDDVETLAERWRAAASEPGLMTPLGAGAQGPVHVDLVGDGPHTLIGGTTGSGKSELLRTLIAGLAARYSPAEFVAVLIDYKGGSAFDVCGDLPQVVGVVTDLDGPLAERALRSLEAEIRHRETLLRAAAAEDLAAYRAGGTEPALPRLVVCVDEFATLAADLPAFLSALVGVAQRGRSLGIHLILATQRPSGSISAAIKANTNLRIALRTHDTTDALDVIGDDAPAGISRTTPGRAYVRRGPGELDVVQAATVSATAADPQAQPAVQIRARNAAAAGPAERQTGPADAQASRAHRDLDRLVGAAQAAARHLALPAPRRPWLEPLPDRVTAAELAAGAPGEAVVGLGDDPDRQRRVMVGWRPEQGHLAVYGMPGAGTSTALRAIAVALAAQQPPAELHLYGLDAAGGGLAGIDTLTHCGALASSAEPERVVRIVRRLAREVRRRRGLSAAQIADSPLVVALVDGFAVLLDDLDDPSTVDAGEQLRRVLAEGPAVRVVLAAAADHPHALAPRLRAQIAEEWLGRLADPAGYAEAGIRPASIGALPPGRFLRAGDGLEMQIAVPAPLTAAAAPEPQRPPGAAPPVGSLPERLAAADLPVGGQVDAALEVVIGLAEEDLEPASFSLAPGAHALVAGPPRSGRSSLLQLFAERLRDLDAALVLVGVCPPASPLMAVSALDAAGTAEDLAEVLARAPGDARPWVVLVDDATESHSAALAACVQAGRPDLHVLAAARSDDLRRAYSHWTRTLRAGRDGVLLAPDLTADGDLLGVRLPRRTLVPLRPGRGFVVEGGTARLVHCAEPGPG